MAIVVYSGDPESVIRARGIRCDGYLQKPIDIFVLSSQLQAWIQHARQRRG